MEDIKLPANIGPVQASVYYAIGLGAKAILEGNVPASLVWLRKLKDDQVDMLNVGLVGELETPELNEKFMQDFGLALLMLKSFEAGKPGNMEFTQDKFEGWLGNLSACVMMEMLVRKGAMIADDSSAFDDDKAYKKSPTFDDIVAKEFPDGLPAFDEAENSPKPPA